MARARIIVLSSPRLIRLDALLVASGAPAGQVQRADDAMELFELDAAAGTRLIADLKDVPFADAGLLRRWQESCPGSRILWVGEQDLTASAFAEAGIRGARLPWPLDLEQLEGLALDQLRHGDLDPSNTPGAGSLGAISAPARSAPAGNGQETSSAEGADAVQDQGAAIRLPAEAPSSGTAAPEPDDPDADRRKALELSEIESILGRDGAPERDGKPERAAAAPPALGAREQGSPSQPLATQGQALSPTLHAGPLPPSPLTHGPLTHGAPSSPRLNPQAPSERARSAFLRTATAESERPIPVAESTLRGADGSPPEGGPDAVAAESTLHKSPVLDTSTVEAGTADLHPADALSLDGPLLTDEEIEAFFSETDDFVIPAMGPGGHEASAIEDAENGSAIDLGPPAESAVERDLETRHSDGIADAPPETPDAPGTSDERPSDGRTVSETSQAVSPSANEALPTDSGAAPGTDAAARESQRPAWLKDQVADLADIVQALDLTARSTHAHLGLERELGHLRQFTRTIGYVAAPPPRGEQVFDLSVLVEEQLGALAGQTPDAPRILFRSRIEQAPVEADKLLVTMALEALLLTAIGCAGPGDVLRVSVDADAAGTPCAHIRFPAGPMADLEPAKALQPYALKARLPEIGANALAAAGAIAVGQGGDLVLREEDGGHRVFDVSFSGGPAR